MQDKNDVRLLNLKRILLLYFAGRKPYPLKAIFVERVIELDLELEAENFNTKDNSVRSIWTYLTASPCYTTNTNKHDYTTNSCINTKKQLVNTVSQSWYKCAETSE